MIDEQKHKDMEQQPYIKITLANTNPGHRSSSKAAVMTWTGPVISEWIYSQLQWFKSDGFDIKKHILFGRVWFHFYTKEQYVMERNERKKKQVKHWMNEVTN